MRKTGARLNWLVWEGEAAHYHGLEAGVQLREERRLPRQSQHPLLNHGALHVIVLDHHVLLQDFNGVEFVGAFPLSQHHLKGTDKSPGSLVLTSGG